VWSHRAAGTSCRAWEAKRKVSIEADPARSGTGGTGPGADTGAATGSAGAGSGGQANGSSTLRAVDLTLSFGPRAVLGNISLEVQHGVVPALLGPTGSGKTTLLRTFNRMNDKVTGLPARRRRAAGRAEHLAPGRRADVPAAQGRHALPAAQPVPDVHHGQRGRRGPCSPAGQSARAQGNRAAPAGRGRSLGCRRRPAQGLAVPAFRRSAATALPGQSPCDRARDIAAGRADVLA
jgi:hypothetical protein